MMYVFVLLLLTLLLGITPRQAVCGARDGAS